MLIYSGASKVGFSQLYVNEERENASVGQSDWFSRFDNFKMEEQLIVCVSAHPILYTTSLFDYREKIMPGAGLPRLSASLVFILYFCNSVSSHFLLC